VSTATSLSDVGPQIQQLLTTSLSSFQSKNGSAVKELGVDLVNAVFATSVATYFPAIPDLAPDANPDMIAARSDQEVTRDKMFALVAEAEKEHYATLHALKLSAASEASNVATGVLAIVGGIAVQLLAKGKA
jgi:hypothetical protein